MCALEKELIFLDWHTQSEWNRKPVDALKALIALIIFSKNKSKKNNSRDDDCYHIICLLVLVYQNVQRKRTLKVSRLWFHIAACTPATRGSLDEILKKKQQITLPELDILTTG